MTSNIAESLNDVLKEARELPIISLIEFIRTTLMSWFAMRRQTSTIKRSALPPKIREVMHANFKKSVGYAVKNVDRFEFELQGNGGGSFHVNLINRSCSCRAFYLLHYPCSHAISAAVTAGIPLQLRMAPECSVDMWRKSYEASITHVPDVGVAYPLPPNSRLSNFSHR